MLPPEYVAANKQSTGVRAVPEAVQVTAEITRARPTSAAVSASEADTNVLEPERNVPSETLPTRPVHSIQDDPEVVNARRAIAMAKQEVAMAEQASGWMPEGERKEMEERAQEKLEAAVADLERLNSSRGHTLK